MKLLSGILGLTFTSVVALASAHAADLRAPASVGGYKDGPVFVAVNWSGFYAGANAGYASSAQDIEVVPGASKLSADGGFGGGQIGYNWQGIWNPHLVLGLEADFQGAGISDSKTYDVGSAKTEVNWFGTVRGRVGYAFDRTLVYATGGFAYGQVKNSAGNENGNGSKEDTKTGYVAGGGIEHKLTPAWSVKAEYQYINLGKDDAFYNADAGVSKKDVELNTVRAGINYHFNTGFEPLK